MASSAIVKDLSASADVMDSATPVLVRTEIQTAKRGFVYMDPCVVPEILPVTKRNGPDGI